MTVEKTTQYPFDLARLVAAQVQKSLGRELDETVLVRLFEVLYFASLRTDDQLIAWENINVALALNAEDFSAASPRRSPILRWFGVRAFR